jgi:hypothetical protein
MYKMVYANGTIQKLSKFVRFFNGLVLGCLVPAEIVHFKSRLAWYWDVYWNTRLYIFN